MRYTAAFILLIILLVGCASTPHQPIETLPEMPEHEVVTDDSHPTTEPPSSETTQEIPLEEVANVPILPDITESSTSSEMQIRLEEWQEAVRNLAAVAHQHTNPQEWLKQLQHVLRLTDAINPLWQKEREVIQQVIEETEGKHQEYKAKSVDPNISAAVREQYNALARRLGEQRDQLYERKIMLNRQYDIWSLRVKEWHDQEHFITDLIQAEEYETAHQTLLEMLDRF
jgi:hypothetical protein